jgi:hypothetical protein
MTVAELKRYPQLVLLKAGHAAQRNALTAAEIYRLRDQLNRKAVCEVEQEREGWKRWR